LLMTDDFETKMKLKFKACNRWF